MKKSSEDLITGLAADLAPVKPLGRLRETLIAALGISLPFGLSWFFVHGLREQFSRGELPDGTFLIVSAILLLMACGGLVASLASAIPGREGASRMGRILLMLGLAPAFVIFAYHGFIGGQPGIEATRSAFACAAGAAGLAVPSILFVAQFILRGAARRVSLALSLACVGGIGVSAGVVHLTCSQAQPFHLVLGHGLAPVAGGLVLMIALPTAAALGSLRSRSS